MTALAEAARRTWDAVVAGAGPAGATVARELARRGRSVLLVDRSHFPRYKVCGCCVNPIAQQALERANLGDLDGAPLTRLCLASRRSSATIPLHGWTALARGRLDTALLHAAIDSGAGWLPGVNVAGVDGGCNTNTCHLRDDSVVVNVSCSVFVAADGLAGTLSGGANVRPASRIGAGCMIDVAPDAFAPGTVYMACGAGGYVGLVRIEDGRLNVAAALDPAFVRECGRPAVAAGRVLADAGFTSIPHLADGVWRGTPSLTRSARRAAGHRLFAVGDAAGYVEPFTGEGIAWALIAGEALGTIAAEPWSWRSARRWADWCRWNARQRRLIRGAAWVLRRPALARTAVSLTAALPAAAAAVVARLFRTPVEAPPPSPSPGRIPAPRLAQPSAAASTVRE